MLSIHPSIHPFKVLMWVIGILFLLEFHRLLVICCLLFVCEGWHECIAWLGGGSMNDKWVPRQTRPQVVSQSLDRRMRMEDESLIGGGMPFKEEEHHNMVLFFLVFLLLIVVVIIIMIMIIVNSSSSSSSSIADWRLPPFSEVGTVQSMEEEDNVLHQLRVPASQCRV